MISTSIDRKLEESKEESPIRMQGSIPTKQAYQREKDDTLYSGDVGGSGTFLNVMKTEEHKAIQRNQTVKLGKGFIEVNSDQGKPLRKSELIKEYKEVELPKIVDKYRLFKVIGQGQFGKVFLCQDMQRPQGEERVLLAIKRIQIPQSYPDKRSFQQELSAYRQIGPNKNVVAVHDILRTRSKMSIVMEYCNCGSVDRKMQ